MLSVILIFFTSCELVKGIFKAGMGIGIFITIVIIAIIVYIMSKIGKRNP
jgi:hypothetical protein